MDRRGFFQAAGAVLATFQADAVARAQELSKASAGRPADSVARDEDFWLHIRHAFTVDRNIINLNNGGVSPLPKIVSDTEKRYLEIENMSPAHFMWNVLDPEVETVRRRLARVLRLRPRRDRHHAQRERGARDRAARAWTCKRGDEVLTTNQDYPRMITSWQQRERRDGIVLQADHVPGAAAQPGLPLRTASSRASRRRRRSSTSATSPTAPGQIFPVKKICQMGARARHRSDRRRRARVRAVPVQARRPRLRLLRHLAAQVGAGADRHRACSTCGRTKIPKIWPMMAAPESMNGEHPQVRGDRHASGVAAQRDHRGAELPREHRRGTQGGAFPLPAQALVGAAARPARREDSQQRRPGACPARIGFIHRGRNGTGQTRRAPDG